jgi:hypothetical protein
MPEACGPARRRRGRDVPARTERYRFLRWEIEDVDGVARTLPGGLADVTRGGGLKHERVVFLGPGGKTRAEVHLKRGHVRKLEQFGFATKVPDADGG